MKNQPKEEEDEITKIIRKSEEESLDYSKMSKRQLQKEIDDALDASDFERVKEISKYLKEEAEIYLREVQMILEKKNPHTDK
jgi:uncharacterized Zn finger protein